MQSVQLDIVQDILRKRKGTGGQGKKGGSGDRNLMLHKEWKLLGEYVGGLAVGHVALLRPHPKGSGQGDRQGRQGNRLYRKKGLAILYHRKCLEPEDRRVMMLRVCEREAGKAYKRFRKAKEHSMTNGMKKLREAMHKGGVASMRRLSWPGVRGREAARGN